MQRPLPQGIEYLIEQFDTFAGNRGASRRLPVMLLKRDAAPPGTMQASTGRTVILGYRDRLCEEDLGRSVDLVPHALIEDADAAPRDAVPGSVTDQHVALLDAIVEQLEDTMPPGAGELRLPRFHTCRAALDVPVGAGSMGANDAGCATLCTFSSCSGAPSWAHWRDWPGPPGTTSWSTSGSPSSSSWSSGCPVAPTACGSADAAVCAGSARGVPRARTSSGWH